MKTRIALTIFVAFSSSRGPLLAAEADYSKVVAAALKANNLSEVNRLCNEWATAKPHDERARLILGRTLLKAGLTDRAVEQFELAAEANPLSPIPHCAMGEVFIKAGRLSEAMKELGAALRVQPNCLPAITGKARVKLLKGDVKGALADARRAAAADPQSATPRAIAGDCLLAMGKAEDALAELRQALELDADSADAMFSLAKACQATGQAIEAQRHWRRFVETEPIGDRAEAVRNGWVVVKTEWLPKGCRYFPVWSPDGRRIMFGYGTARIIDLKDKGIVNVQAPEGQKLFNQCWSPDGRQVLFRQQLPDGKPAVFLYNLRVDGSLEPARAEELCQAVSGRFSPDGARVLLSAAALMRGGRRISFGLAVFDIAMDAVVSGVPWGHPERRARSHAAWLPDGERIVFHAYRDANDRALFVMPLRNPGDLLQITDNGAANMTPVVSPDGRSVAYAETRGRASTVRLSLANGESGSVAVGQGMNPEWSPDGRRLAYYGAGSITIVHLGGLDHTPIQVTTETEGRGLTVTLVSNAEEALRASLEYELFDSNSVRVAKGPMAEADTQLEPREPIVCTLDLTDAGAQADCRLKLVAAVANGRRWIRLVDVMLP